VQHVRKWKSPTLVIHGEKDYRCPVNEGLNLFEGLQYHGVPSALLIFPDENHWILKPRNVVAWYQEVIGFIGKYLSKGKTPTRGTRRTGKASPRAPA
jgi:dipeptidyl aminopeptidase/acylaminoacyl peptidase